MLIGPNHLLFSLLSSATIIVLSSYFNQLVTGSQGAQLLLNKNNESNYQAKNNDIAINLNESQWRASTTAAGYLFAIKSDTSLNLSDPIDQKLSEILDRHGPDLRPSRADFSDIDLNVAQRAWKLLRDHAGTAIRDKVVLARPVMEQTLVEAKVSRECQNSIKQLFDGAKRLDSWAIKLINSWGNFPPIGLFDGTYSEVGSFHTCTGIPKNSFIDHAHYCSITYRPVMPTRRDYELIINREPDNLLNLFNRISDKGLPESIKAGLNHEELSKQQFEPIKDVFQDILEYSQYHHYLYYKLGTCWPIKCSPFDIKRVAKLIGRRNMLMNGPVKCYSMFKDDYEQPGSVDNKSNSSTRFETIKKKLVISIWDLNSGIFIWKPYFNMTQKMALVIIMSVSILITFMTLIDIVVNRIPDALKRFKLSLMSGGDGCTNNIINQRSINSPSLNPFEIDSNQTNLYGLKTEFRSKIPESFLIEHSYNLKVSHQHENKYVNNFDDINNRSLENMTVVDHPKSNFMTWVDDCSVISNTYRFFHISEAQMENITCLDGIRCLTMVWVIMTHTMMYNDWSAFGRTKEIEKSLKSLASQPLFNGSYLVDTFFLMSGLLSAYTAFKHSRGIASRFNSIAYVASRWLRLTPQIFLVSMMYIVLPALSYGPHWYPIVGEYSENCVDNWWINVLHLQAFIKTDKMCNFVTWWISIDFLYHLIALGIIWIILLAGHKLGFISIFCVIGSSIWYQSSRHFELSLPPNIFSTIPQTGAMWYEMTLNFFWTPYSHAVPFYFGFYLGYLMSIKSKLILKCMSNKIAIIGWILSGMLWFGQSCSTYWWVTGITKYPRLGSTIFNAICPIIWASSLCWTIIACHYNYGGFINSFLSAKVFIILGRASYLVYLSHFQILFMFFGNQNLLIEPSGLVMFYIILGNVSISTVYGIFLCIFMELPWLRVQKKLMRYI